jgi:hypothetical protein
MRIPVPIVALTFMACSTFAASARADEGTPTAPPAVPATHPPPEKPPAAPSVSLAASSTLSRPTSLGEYDAVKTALKERLGKARSEEEKNKLRADLRLLDLWFDEDTERTSRAGFIAGVVMLSVGGEVAIWTGPTFADSDALSKRTGAILGAVFASGLAVAGLGIGLMIYGGPRVMKAASRSSTTSILAPSGRLFVSPGMTGIGGTF